MNRKNPFQATKNWPFHVSSGGVVFNRSAEVMLLKRLVEPGGASGGYHLPKGTLELDESLEDCALREIQEESGCSANLVSYLGSINSVFKHPQTKARIDKTTHYFYAKLIKQNPDHDNEHDEIIWVEPQKAIRLLKTMPKTEHLAVQRALAYKSLFSR